MAAAKRARRGPARGKTPRVRLEALSAQRRARLLDPAEREFARHGFAQASLNRILAAAGMSKGQAYHYIADKEDLYGAVIERALDRLVERMDVPPLEAARPRAFWDHIRSVTARLTRVLGEDDRLAALARGLYESGRSQTALREATARVRSWLDEAIALGQSIGAVRSDLPRSLLADALFAVAREIDRWFAEHWDELTSEAAMQLNADAFEMIVAMASPLPKRRGGGARNTREAAIRARHSRPS